MPKFRFPTWSEILALFHISTEVDKITATIRRLQYDLEAAIFHHTDAADAHTADARAADTKALTAREQAERAARVAGKLEGLLA